MTTTGKTILSDNDTSNAWSLEDLENIPMLSQPAPDQNAFQLESAAAQLQFDDETDSDAFSSDNETVFYGPPKQADPDVDTYAPYVGQLAVRYPDGTTIRAPAIVIGRDLLLTAGTVATHKSGEFVAAHFYPGVGAKGHDPRLQTEWKVEKFVTPGELEPTDGEGSKPYWDHNVFLNYGVCKLASRYRDHNARGVTYVPGHVGGYIGREDIPKINFDFLPRDPIKQGERKLTWVGYPANLTPQGMMYRSRGLYGGSLIKKNPQERGNTPKGLTTFQGSVIPQDAFALQLVNSHFVQNNTGAPVLRKAGNNRWEVVGICVGTGEPGYIFSATFATKAFRKFWMQVRSEM